MLGELCRTNKLYICENPRFAELDGMFAMRRIRHCVECSKCHTRYIVSLSPYRNGSYIIPTVRGSSEEYALYCSCRKAAKVWRWSEVQTCKIASQAYERGYGTPEEIVQVTNRPQHAWPLGVNRPLHDWKSMEKSSNSS